MSGVELAVGGWFVSAVISKLMTVVPGYVKGLDTKNKLKSIEKSLPQIICVLDYLQETQIDFSSATNTNLNAWLWQLKDVVEEAEDLLDKMEYLRVENEVTKTKAMGKIKRIVKIKRHKRLENVVTELDKIATEGIERFYNLVKSITKQIPEVSTDRGMGSLANTNKKNFFGREKEEKELINWLLSFDSRRCGIHVDVDDFVHTIVGDGGLGKTALAMHVCDDNRVKEHFGNQIWWVVVPIDFDSEMLITHIYEAMYDKKPPTQNLWNMKKAVKDKISSGRFLLVLDDVWNDKNTNIWSNIVEMLRLEGRGSKIMVTTRLGSVANMLMDSDARPTTLKGLGSQDLWLLLSDSAKKHPEDRMFKDIGKDIVIRLKGSPLAAKLVGGMLKGEDCQHWNRIKDKLDHGEIDIKSTLKLSYEQLLPHLRPLFRYCSIFPHHEEFNKKRLVCMWMGAGLLQPEKSQALEETGYSCFDDLVRKSFFHKVERYHGNHYVMHDLLHDLAQYVSNGEIHRYRDDDAWSPETIPYTTRHLSIVTKNIQVLKKVAKLNHLRTLRLSFGTFDVHGIENKCLLDMFKALRSIRVLELHGTLMSELPSYIGKMKHLRYLDITHTHAILSSSSLQKLCFLQTLIMDQYLKPIPLFLCKSFHLQHLMDRSSIVCNYDVIGFKHFTSLHEFCFNVKKEEGYGIEGLQDMNELRILQACNLQEVSCKEKAIKAKLKEKTHLNELLLEWKSFVGERNATSQSQEVEEIVDCLEPHLNLKKLKIWGYPGTRSPSWLETSHPFKFEYMRIEGSKKWTNLMSHWCFPCLKELHLINMPLVEEIGITQGQLWLPLLNELSIINLGNLKKMPLLPGSLKEFLIFDVGFEVLPKLGEKSFIASLRVYSCRQLNTLDDGLLQQSEYLSSLEVLVIGDCQQLEYFPVVGFGGLKSLKRFHIEDCPKVKVPDNCGGLQILNVSLESLSIVNCGGLESSLHTLLASLTSLSHLSLSNCHHITSFSVPMLSSLSALTHLTIEDCTKLESLDGLQAISSLANLTIIGCTVLTTSTSTERCDVTSSLCLDKLQIDSPLLLLNIPVLRNLISTRALVINDCSMFKSLPPELEKWLHQNHKSLQELDMHGLGLLESLPASFERLTFLKHLMLSEVSSLRSFPNMPRSLNSLHIFCDPDFAEWWQKFGGLSPHIRVKISKGDIPVAPPAPPCAV